MRTLLAGLLLILGACSNSGPAVPPETVAKAHDFIQAENGADHPLVFRDIWYAGGNPNLGLLCGQFDAPPILEQDQLRYYYDVDRDWGQIEFHDLWVTASPVSLAIINENRRVFNKLWADNCEPSRPGYRLRL